MGKEWTKDYIPRTPISGPNRKYIAERNRLIPEAAAYADKIAGLYPGKKRGKEFRNRKKGDSPKGKAVSKAVLMAWRNNWDSAFFAKMDELWRKSTKETSEHDQDRLVDS